MINRPVATQVLQHDLSLQHQDTELLKEAEVAVGRGRLIDLDTGEISDFTQVCKRVSHTHTTPPPPSPPLPPPPLPQSRHLPKNLDHVH